MKQGQETNQIWTQEAGTHDTHNRTLTITHKIIDPAIHAISISDHVLISITFLAEHQPLPPPR